MNFQEETDTSEFFLSLDKDPLQEDFLQGRMVGNPYSSNEPGLGPLMRDVKNKICRGSILFLKLLLNKCVLRVRRWISYSFVIILNVFLQYALVFAQRQRRTNAKTVSFLGKNEAISETTNRIDSSLNVV